MSRNELIWEMAEIIGLIYEKENDNSNITNVVERMNGTISEEFDTSQYSDGSIEKVLEKDIMFRINLYNNNSTLQRKNFTIAHELGHLFLHMGFGTEEWYKVENGTRYYRSGLDDEEKEANQFAAAFLMPKKEYRKILYENVSEGIINIQEIANFFNVSIDAAINRGKWLGYIEW